MTIVLGITHNRLAPNVPRALLQASAALGVCVRSIDLASLTVEVTPTLRVRDAAGPIEISDLAPSLLYWQPQAVHGLNALTLLGVRALNPVPAILTADDKAATALVLQAAGVPQLPTRVCGQSLEAVLQAAAQVGYPVVLKRSSGAQGRWVRLAETPAGLERSFDQLAQEGLETMVVQPMVVEAAGSSLRVIVTDRAVQAATLRTSAPDWRSNVARGGDQETVALSAVERTMSEAAASALGLGHAGVDLLRTDAGTIVLEVNSYPDFTSMTDHTEVDLAAVVVATSTAPRPPARR